jgi:hypothetical protein
MTQEAAELLKKALSLPVSERADLAGFLIESLDETHDPSVEAGCPRFGFGNWVLGFEISLPPGAPGSVSEPGSWGLILILSSSARTSAHESNGDVTTIVSVRSAVRYQARYTT